MGDGGSQKSEDASQGVGEFGGVMVSTGEVTHVGT